MLDAGRELFGDDFSTTGIEFAGRLDPLIIGDLFDRHSVARTAERLEAFRTTYQSHLVKRLADPATVAKSLPGVVPLLDSLATNGAVTIGVLTGNFAETGSLKLRTCGIAPERFHVSVWGDESPSNPPTREDLPGVAMKKYAARHGRGIDGERVVVIGDTPHDVRCAQVHGCRSLAVATGSFDVDSLARCGATRVVRDMSDWREIEAWLMA